ncbi:MAG: methionine--tRNA ligase subunit beta [Bdellovibrionales bacterium]|nr:methionine--tRNA ligase subunit beta [Bdellovibrionales bacterium]
MESAQETKPAEAVEPKVQDNLITFDDFVKVELKAAQIVEAEDLEGSEKLLKLKVDVGEPSGPRQILAGIKKHFSPEELIGRKIIVVANLKPRKMMGHESNGMLLAANDPSGGLNLVFPGDAVQPGTRIS